MPSGAQRPMVVCPYKYSTGKSDCSLLSGRVKKKASENGREALVRAVRVLPHRGRGAPVRCGGDDSRLGPSGMGVDVQDGRIDLFDGGCRGSHLYCTASATEIPVVPGQEPSLLYLL